MLQLNFGETTRHPGWLKNYCLIMQIFGVITSEGNMKLIDCRKRTIAVLILLILYSRNTFSFYFLVLSPIGRCALDPSQFLRRQVRL
jgi:hypothetical protein